MAYGFSDKILRVDLSKEKFSIDENGELFYRRYLGGRGIAAYYLLKELKPGIDPLGPENILIFAPSIVQGSPLPGASRYVVSAKSPLSNSYGEAEAGGFWGPELKLAGFDAIVFKGKASNPVYLWIKDGEYELRDASKIWGKSTGDAQDIIREEHDDKLIRVAQTGPAGENLVRFACVLNELNRANGRAGLGAVMGSKNLRAIAVRGHNKLNMKDPEKVKATARFFAEKYMDNLDQRMWHEYGTPAVVLPLQEAGMLPTRNFQESVFEHAEEISGEKMKEEFGMIFETCYACPQGCKKRMNRSIEEPYKIEMRYGTPEYETTGAFGSNCGISDLYAIFKANELCNRYGLDTISTGGVVSFSMECFEKGILSKEDFDGIEMKFGNSEALLNAVEKIVFRKGYGDFLAEGVKRMSEKIGKGSEKFAMHVKGQEVPMHDVRGKTGVGISYAVAPMGADHIQAEHDGFLDPDLTGYDAMEYEGEKMGTSYFLDMIGALGINEPVPALDIGPKKVRMFTYLAHWWSLFNMLGLCYMAYAPIRMLRASHIVDAVKAITGWDTSFWELMKAGERATTMTRVFNVREGFGRKDDYIPERFHEPVNKGPLKGEKIDREKFQDAISLYYEMMGWDSENGIPTKGKLEELELGWLIKEIY